MNTLKPHELLNKYLEGKTTPEENAMLETWYMNYEDKSLESIDGELRIQQLDQIRDKLLLTSTMVHADDTVGGIKSSSGKIITMWQLQKIAVAAVVIIIGFGVGLYYYGRQGADQYRPEFTKDIAAGTNGAMLTLANGKKIYINDAVTGNIAEQSGVSISKTAEGQVIYQARAGAHGKLEYNTLETANGQQTQIILPDHSKVYLNAASSIKFPSSFASMRERKIELSGEAYFEIAKDSKHPFIVKTALQQVVVLGTHFNINSYANESRLKTTLLEGSVQVMYGQFEVTLKPGQQSALKIQSETLTETDMKVTQVDTDEVMAWKNGYFRFDEEPLESVMRKVARWYNVEVTYAPGVPKNITLGGFISRSQNISAVLEMITRTENVKFKMEGNKVTVFKYN